MNDAALCLPSSSELEVLFCECGFRARACAVESGEKCTEYEQSPSFAHIVYFDGMGNGLWHLLLRTTAQLSAFFIALYINGNHR